MPVRKPARHPLTAAAAATLAALLCGAAPAPAGTAAGRGAEAARPVLLTRPDGTALTVGPRHGCFAVRGPVRTVSIPFGSGVEFSALPGCKGEVTFAGSDSRTFGKPVAVRSVRVDGVDTTE